MSSSTKFGFRPRALDVSKKLPIRIRKCRKKSPKVKRTVAVAPSGMEKEEEMESHLQQAILAQKATSAGDTVENHVIPTPRVSTINADEYNAIYQDRFLPKGKRLINFIDHVPFFLTQGSYNADSEDEEWLNTRRTIDIDDFEHIIERLEIASQTDIIQPRNARALLQQFDPGLVDDVYDYWLQKRKQAASKKGRVSMLIPRLYTDHQRRDEKSLVNPYTAFRRRLDKVQTRKKQRAELMTYERLLQINLAMKRSIVLTNAIVQRERLKLAVVDIEHSLYQLQYKRRMDNEEVDELRRRLVEGLDHRATVAGTSTDTTTALITTASSSFPIDSSIPDSKCIRRNAEFWNAAAQSVGSLHTIGMPSVSDDSAELEKIAAVGRNSSVDGRYQFRRKHGCRYRAPQPTANLLIDNISKDVQQRTLSLPPLPSHYHQNELTPFRCFSTRFTQQIDQSDSDGEQQNRSTKTVISGFVRRRVGRGGRVLIDLLRVAPSPSPDHTN